MDRKARNHARSARQFVLIPISNQMHGRIAYSRQGYLKDLLLESGK